VTARSGDADLADQAQAAKGKATPSRKEAEAARLARVKPPRSKAEARKLQRERSVATREAARKGVTAGDERYLAKRDQGPVKALVRDVVDARFNVAEVMLPIAVVALVLSVPPGTKLISLFLMYLVFVSVIIDSLRLRRLVKRMVGEQFPDAPTKGLAWYAIIRSSQLRRWRLPPPRAVRPKAFGRK